MSSELRPAMFLDRDGVINVDHGYVCSPERTDFVPGIFELCRTANARGHLVVVVTNQAGIARGYYTEAEFKAYMDWMRKKFIEQEAHIDAVYHCPHHPLAGLGNLRRDCGCRKPKPGMLLRAQRELGIDMQRSVMLGDKPSDMEAAKSANIGTLWLLGTSSENMDLVSRNITDLSEAKNLLDNGLD